MSNSFETPQTVVHLPPLSMGFSRQEYWSGLPFSPLGDLPEPGSPALQEDSLLLSHHHHNTKMLFAFFVCLFTVLTFTLRIQANLGRTAGALAQIKAEAPIMSVVTAFFKIITTHRKKI